MPQQPGNIFVVKAGGLVYLLPVLEEFLARNQGFLPGSCRQGSKACLVIIPCVTMLSQVVEDLLTAFGVGLYKLAGYTLDAEAAVGHVSDEAEFFAEASREFRTIETRDDFLVSEDWGGVDAPGIAEFINADVEDLGMDVQVGIGKMTRCRACAGMLEHRDDEPDRNVLTAVFGLANTRKGEVLLNESDRRLDRTPMDLLQ